MMKRGLFGMAVLAAGALGVAVAAQDALTVPGVSETSLAQEKQALADANDQAKEARARSAQLEQQSRDAKLEADKASRHAAALAARIQESEANLRAAQARIAIIAQLQRAQAARLAERQQPIVKLTAALQSMARRPPALAIVQPGSISDAVHMRLVLDAALPVIQQRTAGVRAELERSRKLRQVAEQAARALKDGQMELAARRDELRRMETAKRLASAQFHDNAGIESDRAVALGEKARDIVDLMDQLEQAGSVRAELEALPGPVLRPARPDQQGLPREQASANEGGAPAYRLPVIGKLVAGMGELSAGGVRSRGLTIATSPGAQVVAPAAGRVAFAGPYRGFGQIVIIEHGQGWTTLITSLHRLSVEVGDTLKQGDPVGVAESSKPTVTVELRRQGRPVDILPLAGA